MGPENSRHADSVAVTVLVEMLGGHGKVGEIDGEIRRLLVPRQTGSGVGEPGVAPTIDGVAAKLETAAVQGY